MTAASIFRSETIWLKNSFTSASVISVRRAKTTRWEASVTCDWFQETGRSLARRAGSFTTMNFQGWRPKEEGVRRRDSSSAAQVASGSLRVSKALVA